MAILPSIAASTCLVAVPSLPSRLLAAQTATAPDPVQQVQWRTTEERWYTLEFAGDKAGWSNELIQTDGSNLRTASEIHMKLGRGGTPIEVNVKATFTETAVGKPLSLEADQTMSRQTTHSKWTFHDDHISQVSRISGGQPSTKTHPLPKGDWLTPRAAHRYSLRQRDAGATEFSLRTLDPQSGLEPITIAYTKAAEEDVDVDNKTVHVTVWKTKTTIQSALGSMELPGVEKIGPDGVAVYQEQSLAGMGSMILRLTTKAKAKAGEDAEAPELMLQTFVKPDKPIDSPMKAVKSKLRLRLKNGEPLEIPAAGAQRVERSDDGRSALLVIDINDNLAASRDELVNPEFREATVMVDADDEHVRKLATSAVRDAGNDPVQRAEAMRKAVRKHISKKGMQTAFASASETARLREGDCSEHGVLLCAMLRSNGIPARVATGLVYVPDFGGETGIFGWHMWTQALIDGKWMDFDATLPARFHAAHVLTSVSSLKDGLTVSEMAPILKLIGNLEIDVVDVQYE